jgi:hypothetical protein
MIDRKRKNFAGNGQILTQRLNSWKSQSTEEMTRDFKNDFLFYGGNIPGFALWQSSSSLRQ